MANPYKLIGGDEIVDFEERVNLAIEDGYEPIGGVSVFNGAGKLFFFQALVKRWQPTGFVEVSEYDKQAVANG